MSDIKKPVAPPADEKNKKAGNCPWCNYQGEGPDGEMHDKVKKEYFVRTIANGFSQCDCCGKTFETAMLSKPWSLEVERGSLWTKENRIKELGGRAI